MVEFFQEIKMGYLQYLNGLNLENSNGNLSIVERNLGFNVGSCQFQRLSKFYVHFPEKFNLRIPTENEVGANKYQRLGGVLLDGLLEAVIDLIPKKGIIKNSN